MVQSFKQNSHTHLSLLLTSSASIFLTLNSEKRMYNRSVQKTSIGECKGKDFSYIIFFDIFSLQKSLLGSKISNCSNQKDNHKDKISLLFLLNSAQVFT